MNFFLKRQCGDGSFCAPGVHLGAWTTSFAANVTKAQGPVADLGDTGQFAKFFVVYDDFRAGYSRRCQLETCERPMHVPAGMYAFDDLLADIASFVETKRPLLSSLLR
jgi:hypothetical protein